ncbi:hypothetical protein GQX74_014169 [Glossina fuscipes]|nr:hypothetical protein GQX74_014169 [Glossina fuscipes]
MQRKMSAASSKPQTSAESFCRRSRAPPRRTERPTLRNLNPIFRKREPSEDNTILTEKLLKLARLRGELNLSSRALATVYCFKRQCRHASSLQQEGEAWRL